LLILLCLGLAHEIKQLSLPGLRRNGKLSALDTCYAAKCSRVGEPCDEDIFHVCYYNNYEICLEGYCKPLRKIGERCTFSDPCVPYGTCTDGVCLLAPSVGPGYSCGLDAECLWYNDIGGLVPSKCVDGFCFGLKAGEQCPNRQQCGGFTFCNESGICSPYLPMGAPCNVTTGYCDDAGYCNTGGSGGLNGVCSPYFQQPLGAFCLSFLQCQEGLMCSHVESKCIIPPMDSNKTCISNDDCQDVERCDCSYITGVGECGVPTDITPIGMASVYKEAWVCGAENLCDSEACFLSKCLESYCALLELAGLREQLENYPDCMIDPYYVPIMQKCGFAK